MRLVEFLIHVLDAHAQVLQRLAALLDEEALIAVLELAGEQQESDPERYPTPILKLRPEWFDRHSATGHSTAYAELESAVHGMKLGSQLVFHLWAYPPYRAFVESEYDLDTRILGPGGEAGTRIVDDTIQMARLWVEELPLPPQVRARAAQAAEIPWLRFRTEVLKRIGRRPLGPVY